MRMADKKWVWDRFRVCSLLQKSAYVSVICINDLSVLISMNAFRVSDFVIEGKRCASTELLEVGSIEVFRE